VVRDLFPWYCNNNYAATLHYNLMVPSEVNWSFLLFLIILQQVKTLLKLYAKEQYVLVVNQQQGDFEVFVSFKVCI